MSEKTGCSWKMTSVSPYTRQAMSQGKWRELPRKIPAPPLLSARCQHSALIQRGGGYRVALGAHHEVPQYPRQACLQGRGGAAPFWEMASFLPMKAESSKRCHTQGARSSHRTQGWAPGQATQQGLANLPGCGHPTPDPGPPFRFRSALGTALGGHSQPVLGCPPCLSPGQAQIL